MPRVKIDYVVSFSSEDPDNPASNLLAWEVSKKRWLCAKGEPSCSVVLQLPKAVKISSVQIGAHHAALVEVLVGRSEKPNEPFQVLVPSCIFLSPAESRKDGGGERVRSFGAAQLSAVAAQRWDRVRVVCSQPYNKHVKYGLNFVHISEPESESAPAAPAARPPPLALEAGSSSDDEFRPGELFAQRLSTGSAPADTGSQIRKATTQALKNIFEAATKLVKTPLSKPSSKQSARPDDTANSSRQRDDLMYTDDDDRPHDKIDKIVQRHNDERSNDEAKKTAEKTHKRKPSSSQESSSRDKKEESQKASRNDKHKDRSEKTPKDDKKRRPDPVVKVPKDEPSTSSRDHSEKDRKRPRDENRPKKPEVEFHSILKGVVFALSGYVNPRRAALRDKATAMGARCERDWGPRCNHLICAFPNTPKLKQVRSEPGGAAVPVARGDWLEDCHRLRRRLPWRWYATEPQHALPEGSAGDSDRDHPPPSEEGDTDDEIEKALRKQKKRRTDSPKDNEDENNESKSSRDRDTKASISSRDRDESESNTSRGGDANVSNASDVMFVRDERMQGNVTLDDSDDDNTDAEDRDSREERIDETAALPELFAGCTFYIHDSAARAGFDPALLARYVRAYSGLLQDETQMDSDTDSSVNYVLCTRRDSNPPPGAACVRPDWLWRCHRRAKLVPPGDYLVT